MLHHVCLLHHRGSQELKLLHPMLLFVLKMVYASSAANQVTLLKTAATLRISWLSLILAVAMIMATIRPATIILGLLLMVVDTFTTLILNKSMINLPPKWVPFSLTQYLLLFFLIQQHHIHSSLKILHSCMTFIMRICILR
jgi:hypothetical protein